MYADLVENELVKSNFLAVLKPRIKVTSWALYSGSVYVADFTFGNVVGVSVDGVAYTEAFSTALSSGQFFNDYENEKIYIYGDPSTSFVVATFELYVSAFDAHFNRVPTDNTTRDVYFNPIIKKSPQIVSGIGDSLFGYMPSNSGTLTLINAEHLFEAFLDDVSFNQAKIEIYHQVGTLQTDNVKKVFDGYMGNPSYDSSTISIRVVDSIDVFSNDYKGDFFNSTDFPELDSDFEAKPIRKVYGVVKGFVPVNVDYLYEGATTSDNRKWILGKEPSSRGSITRTVGTGSTTTKTELGNGNAKAFQIGDTFKITGSGTYYAEITALDPVNFAYLEHTAIASPAVNGDALYRSYVPRIEIESEGVRYTALYGRDYSELIGQAAGAYGFEFETTLETNLSMPSTLTPSDRVFCTVYGGKNDVTLSGSPLGSDSLETDNLTNAVVILIDLLKGAGIPETALDIPTFISRVASVSDEISFAIPAESRSGYTEYKKLINPILTTILGKLYINEDLKFTLDIIAPMGAATATVENDEIIKDSFNAKYDYSDLISDVIVEYDFREVSDKIGVSNQVRSKSFHSDNAELLHGVSKQKTFDSLHFLETQAGTLAARLAYILGERKRLSEVGVFHKFFNKTVNEIIQINSIYLPCKNSVEGFSKSLKQVNITLNDNKGVEDNSAVW